MQSPPMPSGTVDLPNVSPRHLPHHPCDNCKGFHCTRMPLVSWEDAGASHKPQIPLPLVFCWCMRGAVPALAILIVWLVASHLADCSSNNGVPDAKTIGRNMTARHCTRHWQTPVPHPGRLSLDNFQLNYGQLTCGSNARAISAAPDLNFR